MKTKAIEPKSVGDKLIIDGCGYDSRGRFVWYGVCIETGRKAKIAKPAVFTVTATLNSKPKIAPSFVGI